MILPKHAPFRKWFLLGLLVQLVAAWFSVGYNHYDEHFQVLEFCNYKLGFSSASVLPWEFTTQCRCALQPFIAFCFCKALLSLHLYTPFFAAFLLRLMMGISCWLVTCLLVNVLLPEFNTDRGKRLYVLGSFFFWFVPYCGVRFSAENVAGILFFLALAIILQLHIYRVAKRNALLALAGLLLGFVFMFRLQIAFAFIGLAAWLLFYGKWNIRDYVIMVLSGLMAIGISMLVDHWFYGAWVFTPYNYFAVNILQHAAAKFGVFPWWYYFYLFFQYAVPPLSIVLLPLFFVGIWEKNRHLFSWVCIAFIVGHCFIGHKEMRFLLPMIFSFVFIICSGLDWLLYRYQVVWFFRWPLKLFMVMNGLMLLVKMLVPSHESIPYYKFIYEHSRKKSTILVCLDESPYHLVNLHSNFYRPPSQHEVIIHKQEELADILKNANGQTVLFLNPEMQPIPLIAPYKKERLYCLLPDWVSLVNFNDWESRSYIWTIYRIDKL